MKFDQKLISGNLIKRYKRFMVDVRLKNGEVVTAHCPNSGSMKSCLGENWKVRLSQSDNPKRKLRYTLEMIHNGKCWIGVNTILANRIVQEAIEEKLIPDLKDYDSLRREVKYSDNSRIDILLEKSDEKCYVEIKNVTLVEDSIYKFPDAVTTRGTKHLNDLMKMKKAGHRAVLFFLIQRNDGSYFEPAEKIDPVYAETLQKAANNGVEILCYRAKVELNAIRVDEEIKFYNEKLS